MRDVPDHLKTEEMFNKAVKKYPWQLRDFPYHLKTQDTCERAVDNEPKTLEYVPNHFKIQDMCDKVATDDSTSLKFVPDWFVTREGVDMWHDDYYDDDSDHWDNDDDNEDKFFEWCEGYKKRKAQKAKIKEELLPITWHSSRYWDWCMPEDEKKETERLWA